MINQNEGQVTGDSKVCFERSKTGYVILTWNSESYISKCLNSIAKTTNNEEINIYIVDNGSCDSTAYYIDKWKETHPYINLYFWQNQYNLGTTVSRNIALRKAIKNNEYICILDSDTEINAEAIERMIQVLADNKDIGIVGPVMRDYEGKIQNSGRALPTLKIKLMKILPFSKLRYLGESMEIIEKDKEITDVGYLMSACWLLRSDNIEKIGLLDENIFYAPEDVEYCLRAWEKGFRVSYINSVQIYHAWQRLSRRKLFSRHNYEHIKGLMYLFWKYKFLFKARYP